MLYCGRGSYILAEVGEGLVATCISGYSCKDWRSQLSGAAP